MPDVSWEQLFARLTLARPGAHTRTWLEKVTDVRVELAGGSRTVLVLTVGPTKHARDWFDAHYAPLVAEHAALALGRPVEVRCRAEGEEAEPAFRSAVLRMTTEIHRPAARMTRLPSTVAPTVELPAVVSPIEALSVSAPPPVAMPVEAAPLPALKSAELPLSVPLFGLLDPRLTLARFVTGETGRMAHAACEAIARAPGTAYSPFLLHGARGTGKSHLVQGLLHEVLARRPNARVAIATAESFTNEFIAASKTGQNERFRARWRELDVLVIEDVGFFAGKKKTEEAFFHTLEALTAARKAVVLTASARPAELDGLDLRLRERIAAGLVIELMPADGAGRVALLERRAAAQGITLPPAVAQRLARGVGGTVRELEGALVRLLAHHELVQQPLSLELCDEVLAELSPTAPRTLDAAEIQKRVAARYGLDLATLHSSRRTHRLAHARQVAMYLIRHQLQSSLPEIGRMFGKDHTTVLAGIRRIAEQRAEDPVVQDELEELERMFQAP